jgi:IclR family acetate operon transcriptional repressor
MTGQGKKRGRPRSAFTEANGTTMQSLDRALSVLTTLARMGQAPLTDIALGLGIPIATTHRILSTLEQKGFVAFEEASQTWSVGIESYRVGSAFLQRNNLFDVARPILRQLMEVTRETANLAVPDGFEVVFIGQVETTQPIRAFFNPGVRTAMHASGAGKAILSSWDDSKLKRMMASNGLASFTDATITAPSLMLEELEKIRRIGWSYDYEERYEGMACVGAAIFGPRGDAVAGISVSGPASRFKPAAANAFGQQVLTAAAEITTAIGGRAPN